MPTAPCSSQRRKKEEEAEKKDEEKDEYIGGKIDSCDTIYITTLT